MKDDITTLTRAEILSALDYLNYLDKRLEYSEDAWWEMTCRIDKLQRWLERLADTVEAGPAKTPAASKPVHA